MLDLDLLDGRLRIAAERPVRRGRAARRARRRAHRPDGRHRRDDPGRAGRDHPLRARRARSWSRAVRAPARPPSPCTAPRTCCTRTGALLERSGVLLVGPEPHVPAVHRPGAALARRDRRRHDDGRRAVPGRRRRPATRGRGGRRDQGPRAVGAASSRRAVRDRERVPAQPVARPGRRPRPSSSGPHDVAVGDRAGPAQPQAAQPGPRLVRPRHARPARRAVRRRSSAGRSPPDERAEIVEELRTTREIRVALNLAWMPLTPAEARRGPLVQAAPARVGRPAARRAASARCSCATADAPWTPADVPLLDEAAELLGEDDQAARAQARADADRRASELDVRPAGAGVDRAAAGWCPPRCSRTGSPTHGPTPDHGRARRRRPDVDLRARRGRRGAGALRDGVAVPCCAGSRRGR